MDPPPAPLSCCNCAEWSLDYSKESKIDSKNPLSEGEKNATEAHVPQELKKAISARSEASTPTQSEDAPDARWYQAVRCGVSTPLAGTTQARAWYSVVPKPSSDYR